MSTASISLGAGRAAQGVATVPIRLVHAVVSAPALLFLLTLTAMLFSPPDLTSFPWDRIALAAMVVAVAFRLVLSRQRLRIHSATWPLLALTALSVCTLVTQPYQAQNWSLLAARWIVPLALFQIAGVVFCNHRSFRQLETFCLAALVYLAVIAVLFLFDLKSFIFPRFILDEEIGIHAERARGPFLQAVANGVSLTLLGLVALNMFRRRRLPRLVSAILLFSVPLALLATKTRAVWISAALSLIAAAALSRDRRLRKAAAGMFALAAFSACVVWLYQRNPGSLGDRLADRSPVEFRLGMYRAGWEMFVEKPLLGWGGDRAIQAELQRQVTDFHPEYYVFHNTYLDLAVSHGLLGLGLYVWLFVSLFRLANANRRGPLDEGFRKLWPAFLGVYLLNASAVVMNYQFVNGLLFTFAGILASQPSRDDGIFHGA